jgi:hypothetical protein
MTLTMIQVVGICKLFDIRKQLQTLMARGCQMALKLMAYQLHIKQAMISQILRADFSKRKICEKFVLQNLRQAIGAQKHNVLSRHDGD